MRTAVVQQKPHLVGGPSGAGDWIRIVWQTNNGYIHLTGFQIFRSERNRKTHVRGELVLSEYVRVTLQIDRAGFALWIFGSIPSLMEDISSFIQDNDIGIGRVPPRRQ